MLLPLIVAFGLWGVAELKQYNAGYQAIAERDQLKEEKKELQDQKDSLNIEVATLLALKRHYAEESQRLREETESQMDFVRLLCHSSGHHHLAAGPSPAHNQKIHLSSLRYAGDLLVTSI
jgi:endonuclease/exonuclease/phosphatase (EEP) superfamily protein YafD